MPGQYVMPGARNAKKPSYQFRENAFSVKRFSDSFHMDSGFWNQHGEEFLRKFLSPVLHNGQEPSSTIISDEAVTRVNHFNIRRMPKAFGRADIEEKFRLFAQAAKNIGFDRTKILVIIRRQDVLLASSYAQLSRKILFASQRDFEKRVQELLGNKFGLPEDDFYSVEYYKLYQSLIASVGKENVCLLLLEEMASEFKVFEKRITDFLELENNELPLSQALQNSRSLGKNTWRIRPILLYKSGQERVQITAPRCLTNRGKDIRLTPDLSRMIMRHYMDSNQKLDEMLDIDLSGFGYCSC